MKLWGGRFTEGSSAAMDAFHSSISFDSRLYREDIAGSIAHAKMLAKQGIISTEDGEAIVAGLEGILQDVEAGEVTFRTDGEDIHMNIETLLIERIGEAGKRLHTARSRNDQVALDMRMYMKEAIQDTMTHLSWLEYALLEQADSHHNTIMPGYTHLQKAQPITYSHYLLAYVEMFSRDLTRLRDCYARTDVMPLGSGALATSTYPLDRNFVAKELGFPRITGNSLDAVSDRDFCIEYCSCASMIMMHLSRFCEELILWSSDEFSFVEMNDAYATGSSIMPQKKNPDAAELIRGKTGRVYGDLMALLTVMKSLPLAYDKDMQEDKEATFDALDTVNACLSIFTDMFSTMTIHADVMREGAAKGFTNATDAADYLVKKGMPFRSAHEITGRLVLRCIYDEKALEDCTLEELRSFSDLFEEDFFEAISLQRCVEGRALPGGPAPQATQVHASNMRAWLEKFIQDNRIVTE